MNSNIQFMASDGATCYLDLYSFLPKRAYTCEVSVEDCVSK